MPNLLSQCHPQGRRKQTVPVSRLPQPRRLPQPCCLQPLPSQNPRMRSQRGSKPSWQRAKPRSTGRGSGRGTGRRSPVSWLVGTQSCPCPRALKPNQKHQCSFPEGKWSQQRHLLQNPQPWRGTRYWCVHGRGCSDPATGCAPSAAWCELTCMVCSGFEICGVGGSHFFGAVVCALATPSCCPLSPLHVMWRRSCRPARSGRPL